MMRIPDLDQLWPFSKLQRNHFALLHHVFVFTNGTVGSRLQIGIVEQDSIAGELGHRLLFDTGYLNRTSEGPMVYVTMTQKGAEEVNFAAAKARRHDILKEIYKKTAADSSRTIIVDDLAKELHCDVNSFRADVRFLISQGWLYMASQSFGGGMWVNITGEGIALVEGAQHQISKVTQLIINGDVRHHSDNNLTLGGNSPIQSRGDESSQSVNSSSGETSA